MRFKNHGLDAIEVQDNGNGIAPEDFETIGKRFGTSHTVTIVEVERSTQALYVETLQL